MARLKEGGEDLRREEPLDIASETDRYVPRGDSVLCLGGLEKFFFVQTPQFYV